MFWLYKFTIKSIDKCNFCTIQDNLSGSHGLPVSLILQVTTILYIITALSGQVPLLSNWVNSLKRVESTKKIVKAAATAALVNPMSCAGRHFREVLNACYDKKIIHNEWNSKCDGMRDWVNVLKKMIDMGSNSVIFYLVLYFIE